MLKQENSALLFIALLPVAVFLFAYNHMVAYPVTHLFSSDAAVDKYYFLYAFTGAALLLYFGAITISNLVSTVVGHRRFIRWATGCVFSLLLIALVVLNLQH